MPTTTLVNGTGFQWGINADEISVNVESFKTTVAPEFIEWLPDKTNHARATAYGAMKKTVVISGEVSGALGVMASVLGTAFIPGNSSTYFNAPTTGLYFQGGSITESRSAWKKLDDATYEARAGIP